MSWEPEPPMWECWLEAICGLALAAILLVVLVMLLLVG
jgi:hypothetical protein